MKTEQILDELEEAAQQLGLEVRLEKGNFRGGHCTVAGEEVIVLNKRHLPEVRLAVLAGCLRELPLEAVYLKPAVRRALETLWEQHERDDAAAPPPTGPTPRP